MFTTMINKTGDNFDAVYPGMHDIPGDPGTRVSVMRHPRIIGFLEPAAEVNNKNDFGGIPRISRGT
eukprot:3934678-Rhodomonas_salina.1